MDAPASARERTQAAPTPLAPPTTMTFLSISLHAPLSTLEEVLAVEPQQFLVAGSPVVLSHLGHHPVSPLGHRRAIRRGERLPQGGRGEVGAVRRSAGLLTPRV